MALTLRWFPPSWLLLQTGGLTVYVDPAYPTAYLSSQSGQVDLARWPDRTTSCRRPTSRSPMRSS